MKKEIAIDLQQVSVCFNMSRDRVDSLKEYVVRILRHRLFYDEFWALKDITFSVYKGEIVGILGLNGAGKSTLLKVIAGVMKPTRGIAEANGVVAPLIELGAGFDPDLTARENVYLNGAVLGYSKAFMEAHFREIIDFAELWEFVDVPVKNFSSGMYARLGFSIATMVKPDILIIDEILGVGDYRFQEKSQARLQKMMDSGTTVLLVSHSIDTIKRFCSRAIWLESGCIHEIGETEEVCNHYEHQ